MKSIEFGQPLAFLLLLFVPVVVYFLLRFRRELSPKLTFSSVRIVRGGSPSLKVRLRSLPTILSLLAMVFLIVAFARPQSPWREYQRQIEGIDIVLVTDVSESMKADDFKPNRLEKAKEVMKDFIAGRENDQIGVVIFAKETFTLCPLTRDYQALNTFINRIDFDLVDGNATAIGMGLANAVNKLKDSPAKSKVVILLTDGENNWGEIHPLTAADVAQKLDVRTYTIGVGSIGTVRVPVVSGGRVSYQAKPSNLDSDTLTEIADMTGGKFYMATDGNKLREIFEEIDQLERTEIDVSESNYLDELGHWLIFPALLLFLLAFVLEHTWLWSFP